MVIIIYNSFYLSLRILLTGMISFARDVERIKNLFVRGTAFLLKISYSLKSSFNILWI